jgi:hypothetical protein
MTDAALLQLVQLGSAVTVGALCVVAFLKSDRRGPEPAAPVSPAVPASGVQPPPCLPSGRRTTARALVDQLRHGVAHRAGPLPRLRVGRAGGAMSRAPGETRVPFDPRFTALSDAPADARTARLLEAVSAAHLQRLLPAGVWRWLEVDGDEVRLVRAQAAPPLASPAWTYLALEELAVAVERTRRAPSIALAPRAAALRCALCHDDVDDEAPSCRGCGTRLHVECGAELGGCPTSGCAERARLSAA